MNCVYSEVVEHFRNKAARKDLADLSVSTMRLVEAREECSSVTRTLEAQKEVVEKHVSAIYSFIYLFTYLKCTF